MDEKIIVSGGRDISIDIAKGITILCVIIAHNQLAGPQISSFHMPLFFILSGYFLSDKLNMKEFAVKRAKQLLIPYAFGILFTIICSVFQDVIWHESENIIPHVKMWFLSGLYGKGTKGDILFEGIHKIGAYWFLLALFFASIIVRKFYSSNYLLLIVGLIAYIGWATRQVLFLPFSIQNGMVAAFFVGIGVYSKKLKLLEKKCDTTILFGLIALWVFALFNGLHLSMVNVNFPNGFLDIIVSLAACYLIIRFSKTISVNKRIAKMFSFLGQNSLIILFFHALEINVCHWTMISNFGKYIGFSPLLCRMLVCFVRILFCVTCVYIINHTKYLKKIFSK